jgi:hypothetical protein
VDLTLVVRYRRQHRGFRALRRVLAVIVYDARQPPTARIEGDAAPTLMTDK